MTLKVVQIKKINTVDFKFKDIQNLTFPIPPLASANFYEDDGIQTLKICATLYINSKDSEKPIVETVIENDNVFQIYFDYDWDNDSPDTYDVWYVETDYTSDTVGNITEVISYLQNSSSKTDVGGGDGDDPKISRGTKTSAAD